MWPVECSVVCGVSCCPMLDLAIKSDPGPPCMAARARGLPFCLRIRGPSSQVPGKSPSTPAVLVKCLPASVTSLCPLASAHRDSGLRWEAAAHGLGTSIRELMTADARGTPVGQPHLQEQVLRSTVWLQAGRLPHREHGPQPARPQRGTHGFAQGIGGFPRHHRTFLWEEEVSRASDEPCQP